MDDSLVIAAVARGYLSPSQLMEASRELNRRSGVRPGSATLEEILIEKGFLTPSQIGELTGRCPLCKEPVTLNPGGGTQIRHRCTRAAAATEAPSPLIFADRYELQAELGAGGMGRVYRAFDRKLGRTVALKKFTGDGQSPDQIDRFIREARTAARLRHPNIVQVHDIDLFQATWYLTMDFIKGESLLKAILEKKVPRRDAVEIVRQAAEAIHHAHEEKVVHRDIKPSNILLDESRRPHVSDFGLAKEVAPDSQQLTMSGAVVGTPHYMSPEQAAGKLDRVDARSDVYALGATLYQALTGLPPVRSVALVDILNEVIHGETAAPSRVDRSVARDLDTITMKAMAKSPDARYATAKEMADDLGRWLRGEAILARPPSMAERVARRLHRHRAIAAAAAVVVAVTLVAGAFALRQRQRAQSIKHGKDLAATIVQGGIDRFAELKRESVFAAGGAPEFRAKVDAVVREADRALGIDAESPHAHLLRARAHELLGRYGAAVKDFTRAIELAPDLVQARFDRARLYLDLHFMPISLPRMRHFDQNRIASAFPKPSDETMLRRAKEDFEALSRLSAVDPAKLLYLEAVQLFVQASYPECRGKLQEYLKGSPADGQAWLVLGQASFYLNRWKDAETELGQVLRMNPNSIVARIYRGAALQIQLKLPAAAAEYAALRRMDLDALGPEYPMSRDKILAIVALAQALGRYNGSLLLRGDDRRKALAATIGEIDDALKHDAGNYLALYFKSRALLDLGRLEESLLASEACVRITPEFSNAYVYHGYALARRGSQEDREQAERDFTRALECWPDYAGAHLARANVRARLGRVQQAAEDAADAARVGAAVENAAELNTMLLEFAARCPDPAALLARLAGAKVGWASLAAESVLMTRTGDRAGALRKAVEAHSKKEDERRVLDLLVEAAAALAGAGEEAAVAPAGEGGSAKLRSRLEVGLARGALERKDAAASARHAELAAELEPEYAGAWAARGRARHALERWAEALADFEKAVSLERGLRKDLAPLMAECRLKAKEK